MKPARIPFFAALATSLLIVVSACTGGLDIGSSDCGPNPCGACQDGFTNVDRCESGEWNCSCVPRSGTDPSASDSTTSDAGSDSSAPSTPTPVATCQEQLKHPGEPHACVADDWDERCTSGCLTCSCNGGMWGCTTDPSCFGDGG